MSIEVVVIGGGIAGASAAWHLAGRCAVTVLEGEPQPGMHATGRSAALLTETAGPPEVCALAAASREFLASPPAGFADQPLLSPRGLLHVARRGEEVLLEAKLHDATALDVEMRELDGEQCRALVPVLRTGVLVAGAFEPAAMSIDVDALLHGYLRGARTLGATVHLGVPVEQIERQEDRWRVSTRERTWDCDVVVNAAGAWCDEIAVMAGVEPLSLRPLRRSVFVFPPPPSLDISGWPMVWDVTQRFYFEPESGMILASPADEIPSEPCDARPAEEDIARGVEELEIATELEVRGVRRTWAGLRTFSPDGVPVVGFDPSASGFFWLAGQGGYGIKTSPAMGRLTADLIAGARPQLSLDGRGSAIDPAALAVERFAGMAS
jgi:D-arginine dehydrogenase